MARTILGLRAELVREVLERLPLEEVLSVLPETSESLQALSSLGQEDMAEYLVKWQKGPEGPFTASPVPAYRLPA